MIIWLVILLIIVWFYQSPNFEGFIDPYSLCLHNQMRDKQRWWHEAHTKKAKDMRYHTLQTYKE